MVKPMDAPPVRKVATDYESSEDAANIDTEGGEEEVRINNIGVTKFHGMMGVVVNKNGSEDIKDDNETFGEFLIQANKNEITKIVDLTDNMKPYEDLV